MGSVIIVGAGPAGVTLAYLMARHGIDVTLLEKEERFDRIFRGEAMMPLGLEALAEMGLSIESLPNRVIDSWDMFVGNQRTLKVPETKTELGPRAVRVLSQPAFLEWVTTKAAAFPNFQLHMGATVRDLQYQKDRVTGVTVTVDGRQKVYQADFVIGCDGRGSIVRTRSGITLELLPENYDILWFKFPAPQQIHGQTDVWMMATRRNTALAYNSFDDHIRYALVMPKGGYAMMKKRDLVAELAEPAPAWLARHILANREQIDEPIRLNVIVGRADRWQKPGVLLLGDAAHPMSPIRAQGINLALRDVIVAANQLIPCLVGPIDPAAIDAAARRVQAERLPEVKRSQALQLREAQGQFNERLRPLLIKMAKMIGPLLGRFAFARRAWLNQQKDLRFGTANVKLTV